MSARMGRLALLFGAMAVVAVGCRGCMRENVVWEHTFNKPDTGTRMGPVPYPEFEMPPAPMAPAYGKGAGTISVAPAAPVYSAPPAGYQPPSAVAPAQPRPSRDEIIDK
ncbi:hypothetical protein CVU37_03110 [candidate division BRC1 bacterium HGW-BRC1-1]|nr:MAG: hypothetical protein CVU37_03110 [candidate division BRC1 bacterium HGW-BRC1-1]